MAAALYLLQALSLAARPASRIPAPSPTMSAASAMDPRGLPGDPSLVLHTNVRLADKAAFLRAASRTVVAATGKPESYVAVCVHDGADLLWGGSDAPAAIGCLYSIGAVNKENNGRLMRELGALLGEAGMPADRTYVNFFDVPRENVGWNGATFAG